MPILNIGDKNFPRIVPNWGIFLPGSLELYIPGSEQLEQIKAFCKLYDTTKESVPLGVQPNVPLLKKKPLFKFSLLTSFKINEF